MRTFFFYIVFLPWTAKPFISSLYALKYKPEGTRQAQKKRRLRLILCPFSIYSKGTMFNVQQWCSISMSVHSSETWNSASCDQSELRCVGLSFMLEPACWGDWIHLYFSITCWRPPMCPNTGVGRLCAGRHQESLLFVLRLQNWLVGRRARREILSSDAMYYKEYIGTVMVLTSITLSWRKFLLLPFYFCFLLLFSFSSFYYFLWNFGVFLLLSLF